MFILKNQLQKASLPAGSVGLNFCLFTMTKGWNFNSCTICRKDDWVKFRPFLLLDLLPSRWSTAWTCAMFWGDLAVLNRPLRCLFKLWQVPSCLNFSWWFLMSERGHLAIAKANDEELHMHYQFLHIQCKPKHVVQQLAVACCLDLYTQTSCKFAKAFLNVLQKNCILKTLLGVVKFNKK